MGGGVGVINRGGVGVGERDIVRGEGVEIWGEGVFRRVLEVNRGSLGRERERASSM